MAIAKMSKFNLLVFNSERENLLSQLQKFSYVHFLDLKEDEEFKDYGLDNVKEPESIVAIKEGISLVAYGIKILDRYKDKESPLKAMREGMKTLEFTELEEEASQVDYNFICEQIFDLNSNIERLSIDIEKLDGDINELKHWVGLDTPISEFKSIKQVELVLGTVPRKQKQRIEEALVAAEYTYCEIISEDTENLYVLTITNDEESDLIKDSFRGCGFSKISLGIDDKPGEVIELLKDEIKQKERAIADSELKLKELTDKVPDLQIVYEYLMNVKLRASASENFLTSDSVDIIEGYVPTKMSEEFKEVVEKTLGNVYCIEVEEAINDDPEVPILLENSKGPRSFESLTNMYALPKYNEIDPTPLLSPFYSFFFGMMVADVGYGLILLIAIIVALKVLNLSEEQKDFIKFFYYHSFFIILWGLIYGSFFSIPIPTGILEPSVQYTEVLLISIGFGIVHIYTGLGINAYMNIRDGKPLDAFYDSGLWYMALSGGILVLIGTQITLPGIISKISLYVMVIGMVGIILTGGRESSSVGARLGGGLYSLYGISSYVGDFVSYSRLMALGLSGGFIAAAINDMVYMLFDMGIFGILFGIVVFLVGQSFNLFLSLLSAYVHSIRLTYVEFFGKFYEGGGKAFKKLRSKTKYINIK